MCLCSDTIRCADAHTIRDAYQAAPTFDERLREAQRYTQHLYDAQLLAYPTTASPTWTCATACNPEKVCRQHA